VAAFAQAYPTITLDPEALADGFDPVPAVLAVLEGVAGPVLIGTSAPPTAVARAQAALGRERSAAVVEAALARVAVAVHAAGVRRFVVAGGETAGAVVAALGVRALHIGADLDPGVPRTRAVGLGGDPLELVLKSGNFGAADLFLRAVA
jgi:uncharacterized protein YgbK (DUF1537 family)